MTLSVHAAVAAFYVEEMVADWPNSPAFYPATITRHCFCVNPWNLQKTVLWKSKDNNGDIAEVIWWWHPLLKSLPPINIYYNTLPLLYNILLLLHYLLGGARTRYPCVPFACISAIAPRSPTSIRHLEPLKTEKCQLARRRLQKSPETESTGQPSVIYTVNLSNKLLNKLLAGSAFRSARRSATLGGNLPPSSYHVGEQGQNICMNCQKIPVWPTSSWGSGLTTERKRSTCTRPEHSQYCLAKRKILQYAKHTSKSIQLTRRPNISSCVGGWNQDRPYPKQTWWQKRC